MTLWIESEEDGGGLHEIAIAPSERDRSLAEILDAHGFPLNTRCGRRGLCRGCEVQVRDGRVRTPEGSVAAPATVRACQSRPVSGERMVVQIPRRSRIGHRPAVSETFWIGISCAHRPLFESADRDTAFAVDLGTTTVAVLLVDVKTGEVLARAGGFNEQIRFGDNVLTRIDAARSPEALAAMQAAAAAGTIGPLLERACERAGRPPSRLAGGAVAGNTTMLHLLAGEDPSPLGVAPFRPRFLEARRLTASEIGLTALAPDTPVQLLPGIAAYIGADITAGIAATGMAYDDAPGLFVDIGTNGEIVLQHGGRLTACATAAGPAFEGSGLRCGTRAHAGAIGEIRLGKNPLSVEAETVDGSPPERATGICGSAYVDFLAAGRRAGLLLPSGRFDPGVWQTLAPPASGAAKDGRVMEIAGTNRITEVDIALLLQAKAAIGAGIETLLDAAGIGAGAISRLYLAGGFGMHLDIDHAIATGLLPGFRADQVRIVGNTALAGALLALRDRTLLDDMQALCPRVDVLELNLQDGFEDRFIDHLMLP